MERETLQGWARAATAALAAAGIGVVALRPDGHVASANALALGALRRWFGPVGSRELPQPVATWLMSYRQREGPDEGPLVARRNGDMIVLRRVASHGQVVLLVEERGPVRPEALAGLGLSSRETEVLAWVSEGKTDHEIAELLGIAPATVKKHLQHLLDKLGAENRTVACALAHDLARPTTR